MQRGRTTAKIEPWLAKPVIPVVWDITKQPQVLASAAMIFLQGGEVADLPAVLDTLDKPPLARVAVMLHIDLLAGLTSDEAGLHFVAKYPRINGIITVRSHLVASARRAGLVSILRLFLQDGRSVDRGLHLIEQSKPDIIELIPGVAAAEIADRFAGVSIPRTAGGLIRTPEVVHRILASGCRAVSTSNPALWAMNETT
ncbi:MAG: glycerol-3-phosphate responsive antiterminator [Phycisphaerae bacterium]|nr:glycerol-3-phosphate responsive antiterminator [Phycisphaerae bacterium]